MLVSNIMIGWQLKRMREFSKRRQATHTQRVRIPSIVPSSQHDDLSTRSIASTVINSSRMRSSETKECERKRRRREPNDSMKVKSNTEKSSALTAMLIAISVFFMVSVSPLMIYDVLYYAVDLNKWIEGDEPWRVTIIVAVERFVYTLWYTNFAIHFILYCLNGPPFRAKAVSLFRSTCCRPLHQGHCALIEGGPSVIECEKMRLRITASTKTTQRTTAQKTTQQTSQEAWESKKWMVGKSQDQAKGQVRVVVPAIILEAEDPDISNERRVASTFI
ncbi:unnamed protein product [Dicrocoelium dendriticum]|nr:unnamed protein product [Dicrocoelium dendriticum]